jgi:hypothetical protein
MYERFVTDSRPRHQNKTPDSFWCFIFGKGIETAQRYFCSAYASKTIYEQLQVRAPFAFAKDAPSRAKLPLRSSCARVRSD